MSNILAFNLISFWNITYYSSTLPQIQSVIKISNKTRIWFDFLYLIRNCHCSQSIHPPHLTSEKKSTLTILIGQQLATGYHSSSCSNVFTNGSLQVGFRLPFPIRNQAQQFKSKWVACRMVKLFSSTICRLPS